LAQLMRKTRREAATRNSVSSTRTRESMRRRRPRARARSKNSLVNGIAALRKNKGDKRDSKGIKISDN